MRVRRLALAAGLLLVVAGCGDTSQPTVSDVRIGQPTGPNAALYMTATGYGREDRLIEASTEVARIVELHESTMADDGTMGMRAVDAHTLPEDGTLVLEPGGLHLMLLDVDRLEVGEVVEVELIWEHAGTMTVEAVVVDPGDTMGHDG